MGVKLQSDEMVRKRHTPIPADLERERLDLIVIGAGINGTGIARDAAMRGLKVLLLDQGDLCSGTSSRSARMIHGGLRYLEHGDVGLVWESLRERKILIRIAPHLVRPQPLLIPFYKPNKHKPWQVRAGLTILDCLAALSRSWLGAHKTLSRRATLQRVPGLSPENLTGAGVMTDAYAEHGERLCIENALAARQEGARIITYAPVEKLLVGDGRVEGVRFRDTIGRRSHQVRANAVVNVAGPWVDRVLQKGPETKRLIGGTKGSFVVVEPFSDAPSDSCFFEALQDQRQMVVLPWNGCCLIGTTDTRCDEDPGGVTIEPQEIDYLLREANRAFPEAKLTRESIRFTYSGVRPLPYAPEGAEGTITRKHIVHDHAPDLKGLISIVGGKFSTFRSLAKETVDRIRDRPRCRTDTVVLPGADGDYLRFCAEFRKEAALPKKCIERLLSIYGTRSAKVTALVREGGEELRQPFDATTGAIGAEILLGFHEEFAESLTDVLLRRTMVGYDSAFDPRSVENAARIARKHLGWSARRVEEELDFYWNDVRRFHPRAVEGPERRSQMKAAQ